MTYESDPGATHDVLVRATKVLRCLIVIDTALSDRGRRLRARFRACFKISPQAGNALSAFPN